MGNYFLDTQYDIQIIASVSCGLIRYKTILQTRTGLTGSSGHRISGTKGRFKVLDIFIRFINFGLDKIDRINW